MSGSIKHMRFHHYQPAMGREAGFINSEALVVGGILMVLSALILPIGDHINSKTLLAVGAFIGVLGLIFFSMATFQFSRQRNDLKKKLKQKLKQD